ncbi:hypothetical protein R1sor_027459 [Riccia sorocarpa]|uniref:Targeting protein for Xklp2 n=1 Tax=Riccia sorocarpa TaxID=122646 RepID=A0ABD3GFR5_9MARC
MDLGSMDLDGVVESCGRLKPGVYNPACNFREFDDIYRFLASGCTTTHMKYNKLTPRCNVEFFATSVPAIRAGTDVVVIPTMTPSVPVSSTAGGAHINEAGRATQPEWKIERSAKTKNVQVDQKKLQLKTTKARGPELQTSKRIRQTNAELEEEMLANIPKFKARPVPKKLLQARPVTSVPKRTPPQELNLQTKHALERKGVETKGVNTRKGKEFHFATDQRIKHPEQPPSEADVSSKTCMNRKVEKENLRPTVVEPFHLETENRGILREIKFMQEVLQREQEEIEKRVPIANPLPLTTDVPAISPKPEAREATRPKPFQLESVVRHMIEQQRLTEERKRAEEMEVARRTFRAQPTLSNAAVVLPFRPRKPLTEVQEFQFHLDNRAIERAEFDKRLLEKGNQYKRFKEEREAARKAEEEKMIKALRKEMVHHARPMPVFGKPFAPQSSAASSATIDHGLEDAVRPYGEIVEFTFIQDHETG